MNAIQKIRKKIVANLARRSMPFVMITFLWTGCSDEQLFPGNARIKTAFRLSNQHALDGSITIQQAYLKLEGITVTGTLSDKNLPEANHTIPADEPPYLLSQGDTARVSLTLPSGTYDQMDLHLFLLQTDYNLIVHQKTSEETPPISTGGNDESTGAIPDPAIGNEGGGSGDKDQNEGQPDDAGQTDGDGQSNDGGNQENDGDDGSDGDREQDEDEGERDDKNDRDESDHDDDGDQKGDDHKNDNDSKKDKDDKQKKKKGKGKDKDDDKKKGDDEEDDDRGEDDRIGVEEVNGSVDLDHFFQHAKPSLVVFATLNFNGENINVVFAVTDVERLTIRATQNDRPQIRVDEHGQGIVNFEPQRWFQSISKADLENASLQTYEGRKVMFIHKNVNTTLFTTLLNNLRASTTFEVATSPDR